jgi:serine/threonine protein kinase
VAIKKLRSQALTNAAVTVFQTEVKVLASIRHPNVVQFYGACTERPNLAIVMGELVDLLCRRWTPSVSQLNGTARQTESRHT